MTQKARLKWACRRGMRELDLLLDDFLEQRYEALSADEQESFARLLERPNEDLMDWLMEGGTPQDGRLKEIVQKIRTRSGPGD